MTVSSFRRRVSVPMSYAGVAAAVLLSACGSDDSSSTSRAPSATSVSTAAAGTSSVLGAAAAPTSSLLRTTLGVGDASAPSCTAATATAWGTFERPFAANSPWNVRPVDAVLDAATIPTSSYYPSVASGPYSTAAFRATDADGPVIVTGPNANGIWDPDSEAYRTSITVPHWPAGVVPASGADGHAEIVDTVSGVVHSFWQLRQVGSGWQAAQYAWTPLAGRGIGDPAHYFQGARASGLSTLGGLIRKHEVADGDVMYRHALAMSLTYNGLSNGVSAPKYTFPATSTDGNAATTNTGAIPMGALMMLPASFDAQALATPELRKVAETLKAYGAYVVDRNYGTPFVIYVENGADFNVHKNGWNTAAAADLETLRKALRPLAGAGGWLDGNNQAFDPGTVATNLLSMRGYWYKTKGPQPGTFDTWQQAVAFPATSTQIEQINAGGRAYSGVSWGGPTVGATYRVTAYATGGARVRFTLKDKTTGIVAFDSGDLSHGQTVEFAWPIQNFIVWTTAKSGVDGVESTVRAELVASPTAAVASATTATASCQA